MNKRFFNFVIHLPFLLHFVIFNSLNTENFVLSCKGSVRTAKNLEEIRLGKNLQIFKTYKKRPSSDEPQENRVVKTLVFPENYPTAGTNNAYLDINDQITSNIDGSEESNVIENTLHLIRKKGMLSEEPITEDFSLPNQEKNKEMIVDIDIEPKKEEEEEIKKEGSGNDKNVQEKFADNLRRRGELGSTRKSNEDSSSISEENGLLDDEGNEEGSGLHGEHQAMNEVQERNNLIVKKRNSDDLEYGKATFKTIAQHLSSAQNYIE